MYTIKLYAFFSPSSRKNFNSFPDDSQLLQVEYIHADQTVRFICDRMKTIIEQELHRAAHIRPKGLVSEMS